MTEEEIKRRKRQAAKRAKQRRIRRQKITMLCFLSIVLLIALVILYFILTEKKINEQVTLEAGTPVTIQPFLAKESVDAEFVTPVSTIDSSRPGTYYVTISVGRREYLSTLVIKDTIAPTAEAVALVTKKGELPEAVDCVTNVSDATNVKIIYKVLPDVSKGGETTAVILLTDDGGNTTEVETVITVVSDMEPPVILGAENIEAFIGDSISYKANVTVTDNEDEDPKLEIDNSRVNMSEPGTYEVIYTATDASGNVATKTITVTLSEKPAGYIDPEVVYDMARDILNDLTTPSMSDMQVAFLIYRWTLTHIGYTGTSDKSSWTVGAYDAFKNRSGDCFNYYAAAKALFDVAGIENVDVVKSDTSHSSHYWSLINLGDGWYHVDCTPRKGTGDNFFMVTDAELEAYSVTHNNSHIFDGSLYPERATKSLQDKVDYENGKLLE